MTLEKSIKFMEEMFKYWSKQATNAKEDSEFYAGQFNSMNCQEVIGHLEQLQDLSSWDLDFNG